jgi:hypothetical protein
MPQWYPTSALRKWGSQFRWHLSSMYAVGFRTRFSLATICGILGDR